MKIQSLSALQIYDSRGYPTIEVEVVLENGVRGRGIVPAGASKGQFEACELRDGDPGHWRGRAVLRAISHVQGEIAAALVGHNATEQRALDRRLIELDGTPNKTRLGANAILGVSLAVADAAARCLDRPLFAALTEGGGRVLPLPQIQIIGGGAHADWRLEVQDFLLIAIGAKSYSEALAVTFDVYHAAGDILRERGLRRGVADEGGYWPEFESNEEAIRTLVAAIGRAGYAPGTDAAIALDFAASDLFDEATRRYRFRRSGREFSTREFADVIIGWCERYPIVSIEDPMADTDGDGWQMLTRALGARVQVIGDDLFTTQSARIRAGAERGLANAVLIKPNQIGTVTETIEAIRTTQAAGWRPIVSARSGETEDAFIAHLAVATEAGQIKVGSFARGERTAKWNELLRIERALGAQGRFAGGAVLPGAPVRL
jgi:enolase